MAKVSKTQNKEIPNEVVAKNRKENGIQLVDIHVFDINMNEDTMKTDHPYGYGISFRSNYNFDLTDEEQQKALIDIMSKALQSHLEKMG